MQPILPKSAQASTKIKGAVKADLKQAKVTKSFIKQAGLDIEKGKQQEPSKARFGRKG